METFTGCRRWRDSSLKCALCFGLGNVIPPGPNNWGTEQMSALVISELEHVCAITGIDITRERANTTAARTFMDCLREGLVVLFDDPPVLDSLQSEQAGLLNYRRFAAGHDFQSLIT